MSLVDQIVGLFVGGKPGAGGQPDLQAGLEQLVGLLLGP